MTNSKLIIIATLLFSSISLCAQSAITSCGGTTQSAAGTVSFSLGQAADRNMCDTAFTVSLHTATLTEGVQQPYLAIEQLSTSQVPGLTVAVEVYPNPNQGEFRIRIDGAVEPFRYQLFNSLGQSVRTGEINEETQVDIRQLPAGVFLLQITSSEGLSAGTYRVVKAH